MDIHIGKVIIVITMKDNVINVTVVILIFLCAGFLLWLITGLSISGQETINEATAVQIIESKFPELKEYPSDQLPPKSIRTERSIDGWYVAFIQEGSGRPVISAKCYFIDNKKNIMSIRTYIPNSMEDAYDTFSAKTCTPGACTLETCHGLDIVCGPNPPDICTAMYQAGDKCLQYAQCGVQHCTCGPVENTSFTQCKSCVQNCINENKDTSQKLFECESTC
jgi:hypothetical protein